MSQERQIDQMLTNLDEMMHKVDQDAFEEVDVACISKQQSLSSTLERFVLTQDMLIEEVDRQFPVDELCPDQTDADMPLADGLDASALAEQAQLDVDLVAQVKMQAMELLKTEDMRCLVAQTSIDVSRKLQVLIPNLIEQSMALHLEKILENKQDKELK